MFLPDLRVLGRRSFPEIRSIAQLLAHFTPQIAKSAANVKDPLFGEPVPPERMRNFTDDPSPMGAFFYAEPSGG